MSRHVPHVSTPAGQTASAGSEAGSAFAVKVRDLTTRSWGDQTEVLAKSAKAAAEDVTGEALVEGPGERANLRARVWPIPFGSQPDIPFYAAAPAAPVDAP